MATSSAPLAGVRVIESSMLGPAAITTHLADLGAEVIKVESPSGDYIRQMTWPIVEGDSLMHLHVNRGKRSLVLDLRKPEGVETYLALVKDADVVIEAMRPGGLERRGLGYDKLREINPRIVFATISGYGMTGPYADLPSHGVAYDVWAGLVKPEITEDGFAAIPEHPSIGIHAGPLFGALGVLAGVIRARATGEGCRLEIAQSDAAAAMDWLRSETWKAYERPESEVTGNASDDYVRRAPGTAGMRDGVRYQFYEASDGRYVLLQASEREFWENFCKGVGRPELFEANPGAKFADHAVGNVALRRQLQEIFRTRTAQEWVDLGLEIEVPIINVNTPQTLADDPQFQDRFPWIPASRLGADQLPLADQVPRRRRAAAHQGSHRRPAHRRGPPRRPRLRRRQGGRAARQWRPGLRAARPQAGVAAAAASTNSSMRRVSTSRLAVQKATSATSMPKRAARVAASPRPVADSRSS